MMRIEELTLQLLDQEFPEEAAAELEALLAASKENRRLHLQLMEQEAALRGARIPADLAPGTLERIRTQRRDRVEEGVMTRLRAGERPSEAPRMPWLTRGGSTLSAAAALLVCLALGSAASIALRKPSTVEASLYGQARLTPGVPTDYRVYVRDGAAGQPLAGAVVLAGLYRDGRTLVWSSDHVVTDDAGLALLAPELPADAPEGTYVLELTAEARAGKAQLRRSVEARRSFRVLLTADKPLYQPGQVIHMRALALATQDGRPVAGREVVLSVRDPRGNQVFRRELHASEFGLAAADFQLARQVNQGTYRLVATVGDTTSERTVEVEHYVLPRFRIDVSTTEPFYAPGDVVRGEIVARYSFGEPVSSAAVQLEAFTFVESFRSFAKVEGATGAEGRFAFEIPLPEHLVGQPLTQGDALLSLSATVTDAAGHSQVASAERVVTTSPIRIDVIPESGEVVAGVANLLYLVTTYADGRPAPAVLELSGAVEATIEASDSGVATVEIPPAREHTGLAIVARDPAGQAASASRDWSLGDPSRALLLRSDRAVYGSGQTAQLTVLAGGADGRVFLDMVQDRRTVLTRGLDLRSGRAELALDLPADLAGTLELHAYRIQPGGDIVSDTRIVCVSRASDLLVDATLDGDSFRPGETATLSFRVTDRGGAPAVAALSVSAVDEAVFALQEMRPGLERVYFALQAELLEPRYQLTGSMPVSAAEAVDPTRDASPAAGRAASALFALAEGGGEVETLASPSYDENARTVRASQRRSYARLMAVVAIVAAVLFFALVVLTVASVLDRVRTRTSTAAAEPLRVRSAFRGVVLWWIAGTWSPLFAGALGGWLAGETGLRHLPFLLCGAAFATCLGLLVASSRRAAAVARAAGPPHLAMFLSALPIAYIVAIAAAASVIVAANLRSGLRGDVAGWTLGAIVLGAAVCAGTVAAAGKALLGHGSAGRMAWVVTSRIALALAPAVVILSLTFLAMDGARVASFDLAAVGAEASAFPDPTMTPGAVVEGSATRKPPTVRRNFPETLLWVPELITGEDGTATIEVPLADQITTWRVAASAVSGAGELGATTLPLRVFQDFFLELDLPVALTQGDSVTVPVSLFNYLDQSQEVRVEVAPGAWFSLDGEGSRTVTLAAGSLGRVELHLRALAAGSHTLAVTAIGSRLSDAVERTVRVEPDGRPVTITRNGRLDENVLQTLTIPDEAIDGSLDLVAKIYPGAFSQVLEGLDGILRMPSGCFEQTSSATYPNVLVLDYLRRTGQAMPATELKALEYIGVGYQRLLSYEVDGGGFEWFGQAPAHVVLTAYGLVEFSDMARVADVDPAVIERTRDWLLAQRRSDGSWAADSSHGGGAVGTIAGSDVRTTAYVAWALRESGASDEALRATVDYLAAQVPEMDDPYTLALCALALPERDPPEFYRDSVDLTQESQASGSVTRAPSPGVVAHNRALTRLYEMRLEGDGKTHWRSAGQGVTYSRGDVLDVETTALAALAWMRARIDPAAANRALAWLVEQKDDRGTWRSTQATVAAMRALLVGSDPAGPGIDGSVPVTIAANGKLAAELAITAENASVFHLIDLRDLALEGENSVALEAAAAASLAYQVAATYYVPWPERSPEPAEEPLSITVSYDTNDLAVDDRLVATARLTWRGPGAAPMTLVDLGIPPGFELQTSDFQKLRLDGTIERYEATPAQVTVYLRELPPGEPLELTYSMVARYPVRVKTPPSTAYQYYQPEIRAVAQPQVLEVR